METITIDVPLTRRMQRVVEAGGEPVPEYIAVTAGAVQKALEREELLRINLLGDSLDILRIQQRVSDPLRRRVDLTPSITSPYEVSAKDATRYIDAAIGDLFAGRAADATVMAQHNAMTGVSDGMVNAGNTLLTVATPLRFRKKGLHEGYYLSGGMIATIPETETLEGKLLADAGGRKTWGLKSAMANTQALLAQAAVEGRGRRIGVVQSPDSGLCETIQDVLSGFAEYCREHAPHLAPESVERVAVADLFSTEQNLLVARGDIGNFALMAYKNAGRTYQACMQDDVKKHLWTPRGLLAIPGIKSLSEALTEAVREKETIFRKSVGRLGGSPNVWKLNSLLSKDEMYPAMLGAADYVKRKTEYEAAHAEIGRMMEGFRKTHPARYNGSQANHANLPAGVRAVRVPDSDGGYRTVIFSGAATSEDLVQSAFEALGWYKQYSAGKPGIGMGCIGNGDFKADKAQREAYEEIRRRMHSMRFMRATDAYSNACVGFCKPTDSLRSDKRRRPDIVVCDKEMASYLPEIITGAFGSVASYLSKAAADMAQGFWQEQAARYIGARVKQVARGSRICTPSEREMNRSRSYAQNLYARTLLV
ncbi:MAG: hypothetical protein ACOCWQ_03940 [Nanoarchaeota archaeon]